MTRAETVRLVTWAVTFFCTGMAGGLTFQNNWNLPFVPRAMIVAGFSLIALGTFIVLIRLPPR